MNNKEHKKEVKKTNKRLNLYIDNNKKRKIIKMKYKIIQSYIILQMIKLNINIIKKKHMYNFQKFKEQKQLVIS